MRPHGRAGIDPTRPRATAICQRCGAFVNHDSLRWQFQYGGLKLINLRLLVCPECYDEPQIQLRTIILPPDPPTIEFPVPEPYPDTDNPQSPVGFYLSGPAFGANIGNLTQDAGLNAAFDGNIRKQAQFCATSPSSATASFIGKSWNAPMSNTSLPASIVETVTYDIVSFSIYAPLDIGFTGVGPPFQPSAFDPGAFDEGQEITPIPFQLQGSNDNVNWTVLYSNTTVGTVGEAITITAGIAQGNFRSHRIAFNAPGAMRVAQVKFNVLTTGQNEE